MIIFCSQYNIAIIFKAFFYFVFLLHPTLSNSLGTSEDDDFILEPPIEHPVPIITSENFGDLQGYLSTGSSSQVLSLVDATLLIHPIGAQLKTGDFFILHLPKVGLLTFGEPDQICVLRHYTNKKPDGTSGTFGKIGVFSFCQTI